MSGQTQDWRTLPAGRELDDIIAEMMEPRASLPTITAHEARLREWGPNPKVWSWTTSDYITSPGGWWLAIIGTDHGPADQDHAPVRWTENADREPSGNMADAWLVVEKLNGVRAQRGGREYGLRLTVQQDWHGHYIASVWRCDEHVADSGWFDTAPLAICRAALAATEAA